MIYASFESFILNLIPINFYWLIDLIGILQIALLLSVVRWIFSVDANLFSFIDVFLKDV